MKREVFCTALVYLLFLVLGSPTQAQVSFFQPPSYSGSGNLGNLFVADFNGDGKLDLLTADGTMNLGNGDGTFTKGTSVAVPSTTSVLAVADFNGDGKPDVLEQGTGTLLVLLGNGDGTFQPAISTASGANLAVVAAVDLNGDGKADVVGIFNSALYVYLGNGNGTFTVQSLTYNLGSTSSSVTPVLTLGDFNGDHKIDVAVSTVNSNGSTGQVIVLLGNGDGTFQAAKTSAGIIVPGSAAVGDFNGDGKLDLALEGCDYLSNCGGYICWEMATARSRRPLLLFPAAEHWLRLT